MHRLLGAGGAERHADPHQASRLAVPDVAVDEARDRSAERGCGGAGIGERFPREPLGPRQTGGGEGLVETEGQV